MNNEKAVIAAIQQVHEEFKTTGGGLGTSQRDIAVCKRNAQENHIKALQAIERKNLAPAAKQAALKAAKENLAKALRECER